MVLETDKERKMSYTKKTTTMHLFPEDYRVILKLSVEGGLTIPEATHIIIELFAALIKRLTVD